MNNKHANAWKRTAPARPAEVPYSTHRDTNNIQVMVKLLQRLEEVHATLRHMQIAIKQEDRTEPPLSASRDWVWMVGKRRKRSGHPKLQARFLELYHVIKGRLNHTYQMKQQEKSLIQSEGWLKPYNICLEHLRQTSYYMLPHRGLNIKEAKNQKRKDSALVIGQMKLPCWILDATRTGELRREGKAQIFAFQNNQLSLRGLKTRLKDC